jgi:SAM-dependent methyltransferase
MKIKKTKAVATAYDEIQSNTYDERRFTTQRGLIFHNWENEQLLAFLREADRKGRVLEVGCGTGRFIQKALDAGYFVIGLDPSPFMIDICRSKFQATPEVRFDIGEGALLPYGNGVFDLVYSIRTLNQTESLVYALKTIQEMLRVTKSGGRLLIEYCNRRLFRLKRNRKATLLTRKEILNLLPRDGSVRAIKFRGILFLSQFLLERVPFFFLPFWSAMDRGLSRLMPAFCSRCYLTLELYTPDDSRQ